MKPNERSRKELCLELFAVLAISLFPARIKSLDDQPHPQCLDSSKTAELFLSSFWRNFHRTKEWLEGRSQLVHLLEIQENLMLAQIVSVSQNSLSLKMKDFRATRLEIECHDSRSKSLMGHIRK